MNRLVETKMGELKEFCVRRHVRKLELFGSAADAQRFNSEKSDLDFLVELKDLPIGEYAEAYFGLLGDLEKLFQRPVDLVMTRAVTNPYFLLGIQSSRTVLYAA